MDISVDERTCLNIKEALKLEWLDTNGLGGYASSTILNCHTRRYHGLLVANLSSPAGRFVLLSKFEESILFDDQEFFLSFHKYPGVFSPFGYKYLKRFQSNLCPHFIYQIGNTVLHKTILMVQGEDTVLIRYIVDRTDTPFRLRLKPFLAFRDYHALSHENFSLQVRTYKAKNGFKIQPYDGMPPLFMQTSGRSSFFPSPVWYKNFEYMTEAERGFDFREDLFQPGIMEVSLKEGDSVIVLGSTRECKESIGKKWDLEEARRGEIAAKNTAAAGCLREYEDREIVGRLIEAARHFLITQPSENRTPRPTIVAGYHWFGDWGRDTLISLPGLTYCIGEPEEGTAILRTFGKFEKDGLLPNFFSASGRDHAYNTVDCSLWYFWAVQQMLAFTGDLETVRKEFWPILIKILKKFIAGTIYNIYMNEDGLLHAGDSKTQLTWMDACVDGVPVTPRNGYAVDINALWYNAVCFTYELAEKFGEKPRIHSHGLGALTGKIRESFNRIFWIEDGSYLGDVSDGSALDPAVRPNQVLAVSLPYSPLEKERARGVIDKVYRELLTPYGLRTLSPRDQAYRGRYGGDSASRDSAYHQGTVWPWLIGHFGEGWLKVAEDREKAAEFLLTEMREALRGHLKAAGLGFISEIFDGDPPHEPNGCIAQSWSVAEVIRLYFLLGGKFQSESEGVDMRVLMLGWEFPPFISGGLGTACYGITKALIPPGRGGRVRAAAHQGREPRVARETDFRNRCPAPFRLDGETSRGSISAPWIRF